MFDDMINSLKDSMTSLTGLMDQNKSKLNNDEIKFLNDYEGRLKKALESLDSDSLKNLMEEVQNVINKQEKK
jgi:hypothetical protein